MAGLPDAKIDIVRNLVEHAPDSVVTGLRNALAAAGGDTALSGVRRVVEAEMADRNLRNHVLQPIAPLFVGDPTDPSRLAFPRSALPMLWRGLRARAPEEMERAAAAHRDFRPDESSNEPFDTLTVIAAHGLRDGDQRDFAAVRTAIEQVRLGGTAQLIDCLLLSKLVRHATDRLPEWIGRMSEDRAAAARLAYKDAGDLSADAGPRFFEMLGCQLAEPWTVLRVISAVMDRPSEQYLAASELAIFALRVMDAIDLNVKQVVALDLNSGVAGGVAAAACVEVLIRQVAEMENAIELSREGAWGIRVQKQKQKLAAVVDARLRELDKVLALALPSHKVRVANMNRVEPRLTQEPDAPLVERCRTLLAFAEAIRPSASHGGFAATRAKAMESAGEALDNYIESVLSLVRDHEVEDRDIASHYLQIAAEFSSPVHEPRATEIVRRRMATAFSIPKPPQPAFHEDPAKLL